MSTFLLINGPNLNLLGSREPDVYGATSLEDIEAQASACAKELGHEVRCFQSNAEHELIDRIQAAAKEEVSFIILFFGCCLDAVEQAKEALALL